jgi:hypothetical protein
MQAVPSLEIDESKCRLRTKRPENTQDQEWAGVLMWVCITFIYMVPAVVITVRILSPLRTLRNMQFHRKLLENR